MSAPPAGAAVPVISPRLLGWFRRYVRRYLRRHFNAVRLLRSASPPEGTVGPAVFFLNHASWWDPLISLHLAERFFPGMHAFAPIDAEALKKYGLLRRLGFFPLERGTLGGARSFLRTAGSILSHSAHSLWLTPQGRFADVRERPVKFEAGTGHLCARQPGVNFIPVAMEFTWWFERSPEALVAFGKPLTAPPAADPDEMTAVLESALASVQDTLAAACMRRQEAEFSVLLSGKAGIGGFYDLWRRLRARVRGKAFDSRHADSPQ